ncbi:hypothetical protein SBA2_670076 [Acidobacteriia bacterium SbA2]|nr:hypothetical protein SBA2_670076 [Acidobacteriia bacterium SbA2]
MNPRRPPSVPLRPSCPRPPGRRSLPAPFCAHLSHRHYITLTLRLCCLQTPMMGTNLAPREHVCQELFLNSVGKCFLSLAV